MHIFNPNCTLPANTVTYVTQPNSRGTFDILWTCLTILFLCTWSVQRPNVPMTKAKEGPKAPSMPKLVPQIFVMLLTLVAPEVLVLLTVENLTSALSLSRRLQERQKKDAVPWSTTHSLFTNMGGFVIQFADDSPVPQMPQMMTRQKGSLRDLLEEPPTAPGASSAVQQGNAAACDGNRDSVRSIGTCSTSPTANNLTEINLISIETTEPKVSSKGMEPTTANPPKHPQKRRELNELTLRNRRLCRRISSELAKTHCEDKNTFQVRKVLEELKEEIQTSDSRGHDSHSFVLTEHFIVNMLRLRGLRWALNGPQLLVALDMGILSRMPELSTDELEDKNKGDFLVKALALIQSGWQIIHLLIRWGKGLPSSQVEIVTVGFSVCAFCIYIICWYKPQNVATPHLVHASRYPTWEEIIVLAKHGPSYIGPTVECSYTIAFNALHCNFDGTHRSNFGDYWGWIGATFLGTIFGLLHCAAWNFHFPTPTERLLWRIASTITASLSLIFGIFAMYEVDGIHPTRKPSPGKAERPRSRIRQTWSIILHQGINPASGFLAITLYAVARLFLMVETFRSLFFLEPRTFVSKI